MLRLGRAKALDQGDRAAIGVVCLRTCLFEREPSDHAGARPAGRDIPTPNPPPQRKYRPLSTGSPDSLHLSTGGQVCVVVYVRQQKAPPSRLDGAKREEKVAESV